MSHTKAQITVETILLIVFLLVFLTAFSYAVYLRIQQVYSEGLKYEIERIGNEAAGQINLVLQEGNGFSKNYSLPQKIYGKEYEIFVDPSNGRVEIMVENKTYFFLISTRDVVGNFSKGENLIRNEEGVIRIE